MLINNVLCCFQDECTARREGSVYATGEVVYHTVIREHMQLLLACHKINDIVYGFIESVGRGKSKEFPPPPPPKCSTYHPN